MHQLLLQLGIGSVLIALATAIQAIGIGTAMRLRPRLARSISGAGLPRMAVLIALGALWFLFGQMLGVWLWAFTLMELGAFNGLEPSLYYAIASYTTLGFGDVLTPPDWRILGAMIGANGMLGFGLGTAALVEFVRGLRQ